MSDSILWLIKRRRRITENPMSPVNENPENPVVVTSFSPLPLSLRLHVSWERPHITSLSLQALATYCVRKWLIASSSSAPKLCAPRMILDWNAGLLAVKVSHTWKPLSPIASSLPRSWQSSSERISSNFEQDNRKCSTVMFSSPSQW